MRWMVYNLLDQPMGQLLHPEQGVDHLTGTVDLIFVRPDGSVGTTRSDQVRLIWRGSDGNTGG